MTLTSYRIAANNYVTVDIYKSPGLRNKLARFIAKFLHI